MASNALSPWEQLIHGLTGEFTNIQQATETPLWYVPTYLWQRSVPHLVGQLNSGPLTQDVVFFLEQAPHLNPLQPYRQRLLHLGADANSSTIWGQYYQLRQHTAWAGAAQQPDRLAQLSPKDLQILPSCRMTIVPKMTSQGITFQAELPPNQFCTFTYQQQTRHVSLGFSLEFGPPIVLWSYDKGVNPETGQGLWGALMGPYRFEKVSATTPP